MIAWRLWSALRQPFVAHPIYQLRGVWKPQVESPIPTRVRKISKWLYQNQNSLMLIFIAFSIVITLYFGPAPFMMLVFGIPFLLIFFFLPVIMILMGTFCGITITLTVSDSIAQEQQQGRFLLLGLTPYGRAGATWALCSLELHRHEWFNQLREITAGVYILIGTFMGFPLVFTLALFLVAPNEPESHDRLADLLQWLLFIFTPAIDYVQSLNIGAIIGMFSPMFASGRANTRGFALFVFIVVQFGSYLAIAFICLLLPRFIQPQLSYYLVCVFTFYIIREIITVILWFILAYSLESELDELDNIFRIGLRPISFIHHIVKRFS